MLATRVQAPTWTHHTAKPFEWQVTSFIGDQVPTVSKRQTGGCRFESCRRGALGRGLVRRQHFIFPIVGGTREQDLVKKEISNGYPVFRVSICF